MKLPRWAKAITATAAFACVLTFVTPATAATADDPIPVGSSGFRTLATPEHTCTNLMSSDSGVADFFDVINFAITPKFKDLFDVFKLFKDSAPRVSLGHLFQAQLTWPAVDGATGYVIRSPYRAERAVEDLVFPVPNPDDAIQEHTISPWIVEMMPPDIAEGGGYVHLTYLLYAVDEQGNRSLPREVPIRVTRAVTENGAPPTVQTAAATCGHAGEAPTAISSPVVATPWEPDVLIAPAAHCETKSFDGVSNAKISWGPMPGATDYKVVLQGEDGSVLTTLAETTWVQETHVYHDVTAQYDFSHIGPLSVAVLAKYPTGGWSEPSNLIPLAGNSESSGVGCSDWDGLPVATVGYAPECENVEEGLLNPAVARLIWVTHTAASSYEVFLRVPGDDHLHSIGTPLGDATDFNVTRERIAQLGHTAVGTEVDAFMRVRTDNGSYATSEPRTVTLTGDEGSPATGVACTSPAPAELAAPSLTCETDLGNMAVAPNIKISWQSVAGASAYNITLLTSSGEEFRLQTGAAETDFYISRWTFSNERDTFIAYLADLEQTAKIVVNAVAADGAESPQSEPVSFKAASPRNAWQSGIEAGAYCALPTLPAPDVTCTSTMKWYSTTGETSVARLTWASVPGASTYTANHYDANGEKLAFTSHLPSNSWDISNLFVPGGFIRIQANSNDYISPSALSDPIPSPVPSGNGAVCGSFTDSP